MKADRYPAQIAIVFIAGLAIASVPLALISSQHITVAFITGAVLSTLNALAGFWTIEYSFDKSFNTLFAAVLGGMGIRLALMLGILVVLIKIVGLHTIGLVVSTLGFYVVYLVLEILYIQRKVSHKSQS